MVIECYIKIILTGIGATFCMDIWAVFLKRIFAVSSLDYSLVGRWLLWMLKGKFRHLKITYSASLKGEKYVGWLSHYTIGIVFAFLPIVLSGKSWFLEPDLTTGLLSGFLSLAAPFFLMQPALGFGVAAAKTPSPNRARFFSFLAHMIFGVGLFVSAKILTIL